MAKKQIYIFVLEHSGCAISKSAYQMASVLLSDEQEGCGIHRKGSNVSRALEVVNYIVFLVFCKVSISVY